MVFLELASRLIHVQDVCSLQALDGLVAFCQYSCEKCRVDFSGAKLGMLHQLLVQSDVGGEALKGERCQGVLHMGNGIMAGWSVGDDLGEE